MLIVDIEGALAQTRCMILMPFSPLLLLLLLHGFSKIGSMSAANIAAMAAGQKDLAGPTMLFAQLGPGEAGDKEEPLSKEQTEEVGVLLQQVHSTARRRLRAFRRV